MEYRSITGNAEVSDGTLSGLVTPFNVETTIGDLSRGGFREQVAPGAFTKTLQERDVVFLFNHDTGKPLARTSAGNLSLSESGDGLRAQATPVQTSYGKDLLDLTRAGVVKGMSFGFEVVRDSWTDDQGRASNPQTGTRRTIQEVRLHEVSAVTFPAYESTTLSARDAVGAARSLNPMNDDEAHARDLQIMRDALERDRKFEGAHAPSVRSDALAAELATATTKAERRQAVNRFMATARPAEDVRFANWLRSPGESRAYESRAMGEGTGSAGGYTVPTRFYESVIRQLREYDGLLSAFELWESEHAEATNRPIAAQFSAASTPSEGSAITDGPYPTLTQQAWNQAPVIAASYTASNILIADAFRYTTGADEAWDGTTNSHRDPMSGITAGLPPLISPSPATQLETLISSVLGESLGRQLAPSAQTALYAAITAAGAASDSGGYLALGTATAVTFAGGATSEFAANTISLDTAAQLPALVDEAYLENAAYYMSRRQWTGILRQVSATDKKVQVNPSEANRSLYGFPVILTSQATPATASTVSGPVFGDLSLAMTLRIAGNAFNILRSTERFAEKLQTYFRAVMRADVAPRDPRAVVGVKYAAS